MNELQQAVSALNSAAQQLRELAKTGVNEKRLYNRLEAANYCGVGIDKLKRAIRLNLLPARKDGRDILLEKSDLDTWCDTREWV